jgi:hypothetical protein
MGKNMHINVSTIRQAFQLAATFILDIETLFGGSAPAPSGNLQAPEASASASSTAAQ